MRISEPNKFMTAKQDLHKSARDISDLAKKISGGKRVEKPSDDPAAFVQAERLKNSLHDARKTRENLFFARRWLDQADQNSQSILETLQEIKIKALNAANSYVAPEQLGSINGEIDTLRERLISLGNSKIDKTHLFGGSATLSLPLRENSPEHPSSLFYPYPRYQTAQVFTRAELDQQVENVAPNSIITVRYENVSDGKESEVVVPVQPGDTYFDVIDRINERMAAEHFMSARQDSQTGLRQDLYVSHGVDGHLYMDLSENVKLNQVSFPEGIRKVFDLGIVENTFDADEDGYEGKSPLPRGEGSPYGEYFKGFADRGHIVRIVEPGYLDSAKFSVSDDAGQTWSKPQTLTLENRVQSESSPAGNEIELIFSPESKDVYLPANLEFHSRGHSIVTYAGNLDERRIPVSEGDFLKMNVNAHEIFFKRDPENGKNVFDSLFQLQRAIDGEQFDQISKLTGDFDDAINQVLRQRSEIGASLSKLNSFEQHAEKDEVHRSESLSKLEDLDMPEAITRLKQKEAHNEVTLSATSKLLQPSLVNFLR